MESIRMIEVPEALKEFIKNRPQEEQITLIKKYGHKDTTITTVIYAASMQEHFTQKEKESILQQLGFPPNSDIDLTDYLEFYKVFGNNPQFYIMFKPIKDSAEISWLAIKDIKWKDIDLKNKSIKINCKEIAENQLYNDLEIGK